MKVALVNNCQPFIRGGAEFLVDTLAQKLKEHGHTVALTRIPFPFTLDHKVINNVLSCRTLTFDDADKVIAFKFPAYYVRHENKTLWMFHQLRQVYELWNGEYGLRDSVENRQLQKIIVQSDNTFLRDAKKIFVNSKEVANRLQKFNGIASTVLYPPLLDRERCYFQEYGDFFFYPSRVTSFKRQHLAIEAMALTKSKVRLVIAGKCDEPEYDKKLNAAIENLGVKDRVTRLGWIEQSEKFDLMARALGCLYFAYKEDSYGFVSMEAFYSKKCVVTLEDSGGTRELIEDGVNGYSIEPNPTAIAAKLDALYENRALARTLGEAAYAELTSRNIDWAHVIESLVQ